MKKDKKITEVNVTIEETEDDSMEVMYDEVYYTALGKVTEAFAKVVDSVLADDDALRLISRIEKMEMFGDGLNALEMLRTLFCATDMRCAVCGIDYVIAMSEVNPHILNDFIEGLFEDEIIGWFLVESWFKNEGGSDE